MEETTLEMRDRQWRGAAPTEPTQHLIDRLSELPSFELLKILRAVGPLALEGLLDTERDQVLDELGRRL
jgi:hypothetical protein